MKVGPDGVTLPDPPESKPVAKRKFRHVELERLPRQGQAVPRPILEVQAMTQDLDRETYIVTCADREVPRQEGQQIQPPLPL